MKADAQTTAAVLAVLDELNGAYKQRNRKLIACSRNEPSGLIQQYSDISVP